MIAVDFPSFDIVHMFNIELKVTSGTLSEVLSIWYTFGQMSDIGYHRLFDIGDYRQLDRRFGGNAFFDSRR